MLMDNLNELADLIFHPHGPRPIASIVLGFDYNDQQYIDEIFFHIVKKGVKKIYPDITSLLQLSASQVSRINEYLYATNTRLKITANNTDQTPWELLSQNTPLNTIEITFPRMNELGPNKTRPLE